MVEEKKESNIPIWKPLMLGASMVILAKLLHLWISEPIAWGVSAFVSVVLFYETPPRVGSPPDFRKSLVWSAASALIVFALSRIL